MADDETSSTPPDPQGESTPPALKAEKTQQRRRRPRRAPRRPAAPATGAGEVPDGETAVPKGRGGPRKKDAPPPLAQPLRQSDVQKAFAAVGTVLAHAAHSDATFDDSDFAGLSRSVVELLDAVPASRIVTRVLRFLGGIGDVIDAVRRVSDGRKKREEREAAQRQAEEQERIRRSMQNG
jgi:hypothetical protein